MVASLSLPFESTGSCGSLESHNVSILILEQPDAMLVVIIDDASAWREAHIKNVLADTDPAKSSSSSFI